MPQTNPPTSSTAQIYLGSAALLAWMILSMILFGTGILICLIFPFKIRYRLGSLWASSVLKAAEICCGVRYEIEGLENFTSLDKPVVLISNHQSAWETIAYRAIFPMQINLFKKSLLWIPFWGWAMATLKPIAIDRGSKQAALKKLITQGTEALKEGFWVIVFPEGTRRPVGEPGEFSAGGAMLAQKSGFPIIPVAIDAGKCWPRYSFVKYPGKIHIKVGKPIVSNGRKSSEINQEAETWIKNTLAELS